MTYMSIREKQKAKPSFVARPRINQAIFVDCVFPVHAGFTIRADGAQWVLCGTDERTDEVFDFAHIVKCDDDYELRILHPSYEPLIGQMAKAATTILQLRVMEFGNAATRLAEKPERALRWAKKQLREP